jgi:uncharacterized membrane protein YoaK (UPF0700 family)
VSPEVAEICEQLAVSTAAPPPAKQRRLQVTTPSRFRMGVLSGVAGYVDAAGFVTLAGLFPAHITGELVGALAGVWSGSWVHELARLLVIATFVATVVVGALISRRYRARGESPLGLLLALLAFAGVSGALLPLLVGAKNPLHWGLQMLGVVSAMGLQNVIMRHVLSSSCPTTVMTGNLTQFIIEFVDLLDHRKVPFSDDHSLVRRSPNKRVRVLGTALGAFLSAALLAGALTTLLGPVSIVLPAIAVSILAFQERRHPTAATRTGTLF